MEEDTPPPPQLRARFPIPGMEAVVATVTGYQGTERFNLIRLIDKAGGNYVGSMSQSITHLVCWKYEGTKYELARGFNTVIVNHQWIEDCITAGRLLPEDKYTDKCGFDVGPLKLNALLIFGTIRYTNWQSEKEKPDKLQATQTSQRLEKRNSDLPEPSHGGRRRRLVKKNIIKEYLHEASDSEQETAGQEDFHEVFDSGAVPSLSARSDENKLNSGNGCDSTSSECGSALAEPSHRRRRRRLVKKNMTDESSSFTFDNKEGSPVLQDLNDLSSRPDVSNNAGSGNERRLSDTHAYDSNCYANGQNRIEGLNDEKQIEGQNDGDAENNYHILELYGDGLQIKGASSDQVNDNREVPPITEPAQMGLSCVICMTDFSATRGVLSCGHRFCFSCIQTWADHRISSQKTSTCPLCMAPFSTITKVDYAVSSDQKIYSQTIPDDDMRMERVFILPGNRTLNILTSPGEPVCCRCHCREPYDLLQRCNVCWNQCIHTFCLDPPMDPWTCWNCKELQRMYLNIR
ncbi:OLC1v1009920C1 [Oldenlandia corymbosa var. corymbosa]|uniref:RING-type E3 ubiquitin transferase BRCA1 n=1 Tax=Oldenlandia corymbosa var. corymbosa TaxID=529605 RepID=A0AAV1DQ40_OLDCO|nr:OLC1v1009920C1 [Oldenlandia corymbosa var. corymbosa]